MKKFLCLCGILAMMLMMTATEVKATEYHSDVGKFLSEHTYNFTNSSAEVINLAPPYSQITKIYGNDTSHYKNF